MANFKSITELPVASSSEGLNLIVNDNGAAKQIAASAVGAQADWAETNENSPAFIKNKPGKELMFEWNFEADTNPENCVFEIFENVDEDLSWLTSMPDSTDWEIEISTYGMVQTYNSSDSTYTTTVYPDVYTTVIIDNKNPYCLRTQSNEQISCWIYAPAPQDYLNNWDLSYVDMEGDLDIYNHVQYNFEDDWQLTNVSKGGSIMISSWPPFKSVKIYKIIK